MKKLKEMREASSKGEILPEFQPIADKWGDNMALATQNYLLNTVDALVDD